MIIYHGITTWHILECWVHKTVYHRDSQAVLILPDFILDKFPNIVNEFPSNVFDVKIIDYRKLDYRLDEIMFEKKVDELVLSMGIDGLLEADDIYVAGGQYMFSHYLIKNQVPFHFFEEAPGRLTTAEIVMQNVLNINEKQYNLAFCDGMFTGNSSLVKSIICNYNAQRSDRELPNNAVDFDVVDWLKKMDKESFETIISYFNVPLVDFEENSALILTQHFANLNMTTYVEQALLYQMTTDYFLNTNKIYVKPHPDDLMNYAEELSGASVISGCFPSELLHVMAKKQVKRLLAISSSSVLNLRKYYDEIISFNEEYLKTFSQNHLYYLAANIIKRIAKSEKIMTLNVNIPQINNMLNVVYDGMSSPVAVEETDDAYSSIWFIGKCTDDKALLDIKRKGKLFLFLDVDTWYRFSLSKEECINNSICKKVILRATHEEYEKGVFYLYIYCEDELIRKGIANMYYVKELINTGIETTVPMNDNKDIEISVLKGILKATENRLNAYIIREKERDSLCIQQRKE